MIKEDFKGSFGRLHKLIHKLTMNEKGYLKKFSKIFNSTDGTLNQILFETLADIKEYDEQKIKNRLQKHAPLVKFKDAKKIVFETILDEIVSLERKETSSLFHHTELAKADYLFSISLEEDAKLKLNEIKKHLTKELDTSVKIGILQKELYYKRMRYPSTKDELQKIDDLQKELDYLLNKLTFESLVDRVAFDFGVLEKSIRLQTKNEYTEILETFWNKNNFLLDEHFLVENANIKTSYKIYSWVFFTKIYLRQKEDAIVYGKNLVELYSNESSKVEQYIRYGNVTYLYFNALCTFYLYDEAYEFIEKFKLYIEENRKKFKQRYYYLEQTYHRCIIDLFLSSKQFSELEKRSSILYPIFIENKEHFLSNILNYLSYLRCFVVLGKNEESSYLYNYCIIELEKEVSSSASLYIVLKVMDILIHLNLKNYFFLSTYIKKVSKEVRMLSENKSVTDSLFQLLEEINNKGNNIKKIEYTAFYERINVLIEEDSLYSIVSNSAIDLWLYKRSL